MFLEITYFLNIPMLISSKLKKVKEMFFTIKEKKNSAVRVPLIDQYKNHNYKVFNEVLLTFDSIGGCVIMK